MTLTARTSASVLGALAYLLTDCISGAAGVPARMSLTVEMAASASQGWRKRSVAQMEDGRNIAGNPMRMGGESFARGIGTHAPSRIEFDLSGSLAGFDRFEAVVGLDDAVRGTTGAVLFSVEVDGRNVYQSPVVGSTENPLALSLPIQNAKRLALVVRPAEKIHHAFANWGNAALARDPGGPKAGPAAAAPMERFGPALEQPWEPVGFLAVEATGEWKSRRRLAEQDLLAWYPTAQGTRLSGSEAPIDFDREVLALWTREGRLTAPELRNHPQSYTGLGKTLVALVDFAADTGRPDLIAEKDRIIETLLRSQEEDGYLGTVRRDPANPHAALWQVWNLHDGAYLALGLVENYRQFNHAPSLEAARRFADHVIASWPTAPTRPGVLSPIGFPEMLLALSESTGDARYRRFAAATPMDGRFIDHASLSEWRQVLSPVSDLGQVGAGGADDTHGAKIRSKIHPYRYFARMLEQMRLHRATRDDGLYETTRRAQERIANPGTPGVFVTGANTRHEGWVEDQIGTGTVGEGCAVVHMVWWRGKLIEADGDLSHGDHIERAVFNHLHASQEPHAGRFRYDCMLSGERNFHKGAHCCDGNHKRFWARVEDLVFYTFPGGVAIDQFAPAQAGFDIGGTPVRLVVETCYPADGNLRIGIAPEGTAEFALRLRVPRWAAGYRVAVNDETAPSNTVPGGIELRRRWEPGDRVDVEFDMPFRWVNGLKNYAGRAALLRGPQVFCFAPSRNPALAAINNPGDITVDPYSLELLPTPEPDGVRRPIEATAKGWSPGRATTQPPDLDLVLSDFPVPDGVETYFHLSDPSVASIDELFDRWFFSCK